MLIGITGTDGAGKGTVVEYLVKEHGYLHFSSRGLIVSELHARGLPTDRAHMRTMANELRATYGDDVLVQRALMQVKEEALSHMIVESIRAVAEVETLKRAGGMLLAVDADVRVRYERIVARASSSDHVSFDQFVAQEQIELNDPDPHGMQKAKVMAMADRTIFNNGSFGDLATAVEQALFGIGSTSV